MLRRLRKEWWIAALLGCAGLIFAGYRLSGMREVNLMIGAVLRQDADPGKQLPIQNVQVVLKDGLAAEPSVSSATGFFRLKLKNGIRRGDSVTLQLRHPDYQPTDLPEYVTDRLYVIRMVPVRKTAPPALGEHPIAITDVRIRYAAKSRNTVNIGSAVKAFEVVNRGDVPCDKKGPCSPDRKWKANVGGASLDAGDGNVFENARVTCIAGPCPFTRIEKDSFSNGGRNISVLVRNWSDTATFVLAAEVMHSSVYDEILQTFPVILGQAMSFTLPYSAQGPSVEAIVNGEDIVYPLGPKLKLSWAQCEVQVVPGVSKLYQCVINPGYRVQ